MADQEAGPLPDFDQKLWAQLLAGGAGSGVAHQAPYPGAPFSAPAAPPSDDRLSAGAPPAPTPLPGLPSLSMLPSGLNGGAPSLPGGPPPFLDPDQQLFLMMLQQRAMSDNAAPRPANGTAPTPQPGALPGTQQPAGALIFMLARYSIVLCRSHFQQVA